MSSRQAWDDLRIKLLRGGREAEEQLYDQLGECAAVCSPPAGRADFLHDLFLSVMQAMLKTGRGIKLEEIRNLRAYCYRVAENLACDQGASRAHDAARSLPPTTEDRRRNAVPAADSGLLRRELRDVICHCLDLLPRADVQVLRLCAFEGRTLAEAAERLSTPGAPMTHSAAETRLKRARASLRALLRERGLLPQGPAPAPGHRVGRWLGCLLLVGWQVVFATLA